MEPEIHHQAVYGITVIVTAPVLLVLISLTIPDLPACVPLITLHLEPSLSLGCIVGVIDKSIRELRAIFKLHPEWFETPKQKSDKGRNVVDYSIQ